MVQRVVIYVLYRVGLRLGAGVAYISRIVYIDSYVLGSCKAC